MCHSLHVAVNKCMNCFVHLYNAYAATMSSSASSTSAQSAVGLMHKLDACTPDTSPISRQALGRVAGLGDLYNAVSDEFCGMTIFGQTLPPDCPAITITDTPHTNTESNTVSRFEEKFKNLTVTGELQLSVLSGMLDGLDGTVKYLTTRKESYKSAEYSYVHHVKTAKEHLELDDRVKKYILHRIR